MADSSQGANGSVFISYSRKDKAFVQRLNDALDIAGVQAWVDWEGIELASDWMANITNAIQGTDAFLFIISPDSLKSKVCADELSLGIKLNKKLIPVLYRVPENGETMHEKLAATNWVYLRQEDNFETTLPKLIEAVNTDLGWVRQHTQLLGQATEWEKKNKDSSFLLNGVELKDAEQWMAAASGKANRQILPLQADYISASRKAADESGVISIWDISSLSARLSYIEFREYVHEARLAPSGEYLIVNTDDYNVWKIPAKELGQVTDGTQGEVIFSAKSLTYDTALSPDSKWVAAIEYNSENAQNDRGILVSLDGQTQFPLPHGGEVTGIAFDNESKFVATAGLNGLVSFWEVTTGKKQQLDLDNSEPVNSLAFSPLGKLTATELHDKTRIWDIAARQSVTDLPQKGDIISLIFSQDGKWLATGSADGTVLLWEVDGSLFKQAGEALHLNGKPQALAFSPDDKWLVGGSSSGFANLWDTETAQEVARIPHSDPVTGVSFSLDGSQLLTVSRKVVRIWNVSAIPLVPRDQLVTSACSHLTSNLSRDAWVSFFGNEEYRRICPNLPEEK